MASRGQESRFARLVPLSFDARRLGLLLTIAILLGGAAWMLRHASAQSPGSDGSQQEAPASTPPLGDVHALARLEPASGLILLGARPGARIEQVSVKPADMVSAGQVVAILEGHDQARAQLALAEAQKARALHEHSLRKKKLALEREKADSLQKARLDSAGKVLASRQRFDQLSKLYGQLKDKLENKARFDLEREFLESEIQNLRGELEVKEFQIAQQLTPRSRAVEDEALDDSGPDMKLLDRQIDLARTAVAQAELRAPVSGKVLDVLVHEGEVGSGPVLQLGDVGTMVAVAEVDQSDIPRLRVGDRATVEILEKEVPARVTRISAIVGKNQLTSFDPRALQDRRVVKVTLQLDDPSAAASFVNMEVEAAIQPSGHPGS
jgi:HlyD family secretion protein